MNPNGVELPKFQTPEEELAYLRAKVAEQGSATEHAPSMSRGIERPKEAVAESYVTQYKEQKQATPQPIAVVFHDADKHELALKLKPEAHDMKMEELLGILLSKGIRAALDIAEKLHDPHVDDDFHRFLVQYLATEHGIPGLRDKEPLFKVLSMTLFEVTLPPPKENPQAADFKKLLGGMEQFYASMLSIASDPNNKEHNHYTIEIALPEGSDEVIIYAAVPTRSADLFEKQVVSFYQDAKVRQVPDDYNIFSQTTVASGSYAKLATYPVYPIKTHDTIESDPMSSLLTVFSKFKKSGEGASVQFLISPAGDSFVKDFTHTLSELKKGESMKAIDRASHAGSAFLDAAGAFFKSTDKDKEKEVKPNDDIALTNVTEKLKSTIVQTGIRIIASAGDRTRAEAMRTEIESSFQQFSNPTANHFVFESVAEKYNGEFLREYSYRLFSSLPDMPLNLHELATIFHFPVGVGNPQLKEAKAGMAPAPLNISTDGILLGYNNYRDVSTPIHMSREDRMRHFYIIGQTGTGKTALLKQMIKQDIENGEGCCFIDPHGNDIQDILSYIPKERMNDVIYFDPAYTPRPMGLNMLEYDVRFPEQKSMVIDMLMMIFGQLFDLKTSGGPMFEQYFKNSALLVMDHPESGNTLLEISRVLTDKTFREMKLGFCKNPIIKQFWAAAEKTTGESGLQNMVGYITSKFDNFISNEFMRPVVLQERSVFNFRDIMDNKKILLVNLSKGRLGELNANLIGMLIVMKFQMAALSRVDSYGKTLADFYLYIDEFQNVTTPAIASILSEARKYRLSLNIAHQYIGQLPEDIKNAVFGNVGSMAIFRVSPEDAQVLEPKFTPTFTAQDITRLDNLNAYMQMIINGAPAPRPFNIVLPPFPVGNSAVVDELKQLSYLTYGRPREEVEAEVLAKFQAGQK